MYSLVLMAALSGNAATPGWFHHHCAASCCGCYGSCYGCYGSCYGCYGSCHGCWSSGYGCWSSCSGCYGSSYGGWGSCYGCHGCYGSYSYYTGCSGCYGSCYGSYGACYGCYGCYGGYGYSDYAPVQVVPSAEPAHIEPAQEAPREEPLPAPKKDEKKGTLAPTRAKLTVELPPDARLYIDGRLMKTPSGRRSFATPALQPGQLYFYEMRAEVTRDGKTSSDTRRVIVRAGADVMTSFDNLTDKATATARADDR